jgi:glycosyltransferase involved in cell wall biosynthesis
LSVPLVSTTVAPLPSYAIALSTFNAGRYLAEQIESIRGQVASNWRLYVRDDGSSDDTPAQIARFAALDRRITVVADDAGNLGAPASFGALLCYTLERGEAYVFLSDQDDVWLPHKTERLLEAALEREALVGAQTPLLVHSDLRVVSADLDLIHPSYLALQQLDPHEDSRPTRLLFRNAVTGCATLINRALLERSLPFPRVAMHDWWLAQCAALFGQITFVDEATVLYRQHGTNALGARGLTGTLVRALRSPRRSGRYFLNALEQLWELRRRVALTDSGSPAAFRYLLDDLHAALARDGTTALQRVRAVWRGDARPRGIAAQAWLLARVVILPWLRERYGPSMHSVA